MLNSCLLVMILKMKLLNHFLFFLLMVSSHEQMASEVNAEDKFQPELGKLSEVSATSIEVLLPNKVKTQAKYTAKENQHDSMKRLNITLSSDSSYTAETAYEDSILRDLKKKSNMYPMVLPKSSIRSARRQRSPHPFDKTNGPVKGKDEGANVSTPCSDRTVDSNSTSLTDDCAVTDDLKSQVESYLEKIASKSPNDISIIELCYVIILKFHTSGLPSPLPDYYKYVFEDEKAFNVCRTLFLEADVCYPVGLLTICLEGNNTIFAQEQYTCYKTSDAQIYLGEMMALALMEEDLECFQKICDGNVLLTEIVVDAIPVLLIPPTGGMCVDYAAKIAVIYAEDFYSTVNSYWPFCYESYNVFWSQNPQSKGLSRDWSYLPLKCRAGEIFIVASLAVVAVVGMVGNLLVIVVMLSGGHRSEASSFLRTSLALADLFICIFVIPSSVYDSISIINDHMDPAMHSHFDRIDGVLNDSFSEQYYKIFSYSDGRMKVIQAYVCHLCFCVSMMTMFFLSIERFVITKWPFRYKRYFTIQRVKLCIFLSWTFGLVFLGYISSIENVFWNSFAKISLGISEGIHTVNMILIILGVCTIIFSVLALYSFLKEQARVAAEMKSLDMRVTGNYDKENIYIIMSLLIITILFMAVNIPFGILVSFGSRLRTKVHYSIFLSLSFWFLLAGSATNPIVYNMRSHQFKSDSAELVQKILPKPLKSKMKPFITHSQKKVENYLKELDEEAARVGNTRGHDGLPAGSKLAALGLGFQQQSVSY